MARKTKTKAPRTARAKAPERIEAPADGIEIGSPVWIRWDVGRFKLGFLVARTREMAICRVAMVDAKGAYTGDVGKERRTFKPGEISRVFMERDWESTRPTESLRELDARIARGPRTDTRGNAIAENDDIREIESVLAAAHVPTKSPEGAVMTTVERIEHVLAFCDELQQRIDDDRDDNMRRTMSLQAKVGVAKDAIIDLKTGPRSWVTAKITMLDHNEMHFVDVTGNGGSRPLSEEGASWMINTSDSLATFERRAAAWTKEHAKKTNGRRASTHDAKPDESITTIASDSGTLVDRIIEVRIGSNHWETVRVFKMTPDLIFFRAHDGTEGSRTHAQRGRDWKVPPADSPLGRMDLSRVDPTTTLTNPQRLDESTSERPRANPEDIAAAAERQRKETDGQLKTAARKAGRKGKKLSPAERAFAEGQAMVTEREVSTVEEPFESTLVPPQRRPIPAPEPVAPVPEQYRAMIATSEPTQRQRDVAEAKERRITTQQVVEERQAREAAAARDANADVDAVNAVTNVTGSIVAAMSARPFGEPSAPDRGRRPDAEEREIASTRDLEAVASTAPWIDDAPSAVAFPWETE